MESYIQIRNELLNTQENSLKIKTPSNNTITFQDPVYGKNARLYFEKDIDKLSMTFLRYDITTEGIVADGIIGYKTLAHKLMSDIMLMGDSTTALMTIKPSYAIFKYKEYFGRPIYSCIENSISPDTSFYEAPTTSTTTSLYFPVEFFYSNPKCEPLSIRNLKDLYIYLSVSNIEDIGLKDAVSGDNIKIIGIKVSMEQESFNNHLTNRNLFLNDTNISIQRSLKNTYDVFYEELQTIEAGKTSHTMLLTCPNALVNITAMVYNSDYEYEVQSFMIKVKNSTFVDMNRKTNYSFRNTDVSYTQNKHLTYWVNKDEKVLSKTGYLTFSENDAFFPAYLTVKFTAPTVQSYLAVFMEVLSDLEVNSKGVISKNDLSF